MKEEYDKVVLDAANIIHDDTGVKKFNEDGDRIIQILPERLEAAITHCEDLGWPTVACLKRGTYKWAATNPESPFVGDISIVDRLISEGKVILLSAQKEDIYWIDYALKENAWIVTHDRFNDRKKNGASIQGERSLYPDRDWDTIDKCTLRGHEFLNNKFILPGLPKKQTTAQLDEEFITHAQYNQLCEQVKELQKMVRDITHSEVRKSVTTSSSRDDHVNQLEILDAVTNQVLSNGKRVEIGHFHRLVGSAILGLDMDKYYNWPKGWPTKLSNKLGFTGKFYDALKKHSNKNICTALKKGTKGTQEAFYC
jgi:hypothetical protein